LIQQNDMTLEAVREWRLCLRLKHLSQAKVSQERRDRTPSLDIAESGMGAYFKPRHIIQDGTRTKRRRPGRLAPGQVRPGNSRRLV